MATVKPFKFIHPSERVAAEVAALPYDVYSRSEAKEAVQGHPLSFLNIDRPETQFGPDFDMYSDEAYQTARKLLESQIADGTYVTDDKPSYYIYELTMDGRKQTGIVGGASIEEYGSGRIKKHENTLAEKELDRINHVRTVGAQTGPIFLAYRDNEKLDAIVAAVKQDKPVFDFISSDGIGHRVWHVVKDADIEGIEKNFGEVKALYIADGHHRAASAYRVGSGDGLFLSVIFPQSQLKILPYNRAVRDLNGLSPEELIKRISQHYEVAECEAPKEEDKKKDRVFMYLAGKWYRMDLKSAMLGKPIYVDPVESLDVSVLQNDVLQPILGIGDPRTDERISFVGGIRGDKELVKMVDSGEYKVAFSMYPTQMEELLNVADNGLLMPPKSTWFEPKLRSGLFIHKIG